MPVLFEPLPGRAGTLVVMNELTIAVGEIIEHNGKLQFHYYPVAGSLKPNNQKELEKVVTNHISITNRLLG